VELDEARAVLLNPPVPLPTGSAPARQIVEPTQLPLFGPAATAGTAQLPVLNAHFKPDPFTAFQSLTAEANARLANNTALARTVLSRAEYAAGQRSAPIRSYAVWECG
jgi:hypothetical protein